MKYNKQKFINYDSSPFNEARFEKHSIAIQIERFYTDVDGALLLKTDPAIPLNLKVKYPIFMFGAFDLAGGYSIGMKNNPPPPGPKYLLTFINGYNATSYGVTGVNGNNAIQERLEIGDIVHVFADNLGNPTYYVWIVQHSDSPLGAIVDNTKTTQKDGHLGYLFVRSISYPTNNELQWNEPVMVIFPDNVADYRSDTYQPLIWRTPQTGFTRSLELLLDFMVDQFIGFSTYIRFDTDSLQLTFNIEKTI